jgi:hypothetical protein
MSKQTTSVAAQPMKLKRPRGAIRRAIVAGIWTAKQAHENGYMSKAEFLRPRVIKRAPR